MIKNEARADKERWIKKRLGGTSWDPIKEVSRKASPQVVALRRGGEGKGGRGDTREGPADIYAEHLQHIQWGLQEEPREEPEGA